MLSEFNLGIQVSWPVLAEHMIVEHIIVKLFDDSEQEFSTSI